MSKAEWISIILLQFKHYACQRLKWRLLTKHESV
jgi:hypothetical protein